MLDSINVVFALRCSKSTPPVTLTDIFFVIIVPSSIHRDCPDVRMMARRSVVFIVSCNWELEVFVANKVLTSVLLLQLAGFLLGDVVWVVYYM